MKRWLFFLCCLPVLLWPVTVVAGALPELRLSFRGGTGALQREVWTQPAALSVVMPDGREVYRSRRAAVKLHGHSTAAKAKKPVALHLASPAPLLGMARGRRWVLLANVMDHSYMRNRLAFAMARLTSLPWTPDSRFVNVVVNGRPQGCYLLVEAVRVGPQRVDVGGRGGFLVELDAYRDASAVFLTPRRRLPVGVKWPADPSPRRLRQIRSFFDCVEELLYGAPADTGRLWSECLDRLSFTDWWIVHELAQNAEPNGPRSCYMYRPAGGLLHAGPVWDFDLSFIDVGLDAGGDLRPARLRRTDAVLLTVDSIYNRRALWFDRLLADSVFCDGVRRRWQELSPRFHALADSIDVWHAALAEAARSDAFLWPGADPARFDDSPTFDAAVGCLRRTYLARLERLDSLFGGHGVRP